MSRRIHPTSALFAVLALHSEDDYGFCNHCSEVSGDIAIPWPCETVQTIEEYGV